MEFILFLIFSFICIAAVLNMLFQKESVYCALSLVVCMASLACLYLLLQAPFAAAIQIIIYAGAVMVLFLFVIMLLDPRSDSGSGRPRRMLFLATVLGISLFAALAVFLSRSQSFLNSGHPKPAAGQIGAVEVGLALFHRYLIPLEAVGILILMATLGAVLLAKKKI